MSLIDIRQSSVTRPIMNESSVLKKTDGGVDLVGITFVMDFSYERSGGGARMKKTKLSLLVLCLLFLIPTLARAEWFLDVYGGEASTQDARITAEITSYGILMATTTKSHTEKAGFDASLTMGGRLGYWFEKLPWLGFSLDLSYFKAEGEKAEFDVVPLSLLFMLRYPLFKSENFPKGKLQPYAGVGLAYFFTDSRVNFRPALQDSVSGSSDEIGFDVRAGLSWQFHKHWAIFGEYRYTDVKLDFTQEDFLPIFSGTDESMKTRLKTNHFLMGISYRF
jgi:Outer membrane protein beta-barrel domain